LKLIVDPIDRLNKSKKNNPPAFMTYTPDGILKDTEQEIAYENIASQLVTKAMNGVSGMIVALGPEQSGKFYTLFGSSSHSYQV